MSGVSPRINLKLSRLPQTNKPASLTYIKIKEMAAIQSLHGFRSYVPKNGKCCHQSEALITDEV